LVLCPLGLSSELYGRVGRIAKSAGILFGRSARIAVLRDASFAVRYGVAPKATWEVPRHADAKLMASFYTERRSEAVRLELEKFDNSITVIGVPAFGDLIDVTIPVGGFLTWLVGELDRARASKDTKCNIMGYARIDNTEGFCTLLIYFNLKFKKTFTGFTNIEKS
jgi:hypothetical protein